MGGKHGEAVEAGDAEGGRGETWGGMGNQEKQ